MTRSARPRIAPFGEFAEEWRQTYETGLKHKAARNKLKRIVQVICKPLHKLRLDEMRPSTSLPFCARSGISASLARHAPADQEDFGRGHRTEPAAETQPGRLGQPTEPIMPKQRKRGTVRGGHKAMDYHDLPRSCRSSPSIPIKAHGRLRSLSSHSREPSRSEHALVASRSRKWDLGPAPSIPRTNGSSGRHCPGKHSRPYLRPT